jgi:hypothetical protein
VGLEIWLAGGGAAMAGWIAGSLMGACLFRHDEFTAAGAPQSVDFAFVPDENFVPARQQGLAVDDRARQTVELCLVSLWWRAATTGIAFCHFRLPVRMRIMPIQY